MSGESVTIKTIESRVELDPYRMDTIGASRTELYIDPTKREASILQWWPGANSTPMNEWHRIVLAYPLEITPDEYNVRVYLEGDEAQALLIAICEGHDTEWDGNNLVGTMTMEALRAVEELVGELNDLPESDWSLLSVREWFDGATEGLSAAATDDDIEALAKMFELTAEGDHIVLVGSVIDYLTECRYEMREGGDA